MCGPRATALPGDIEFAQSSSAARAAFDRGDSKLAAVLYERAGARARLIAEAQSIADVDFNQAWCETELGDYDRADGLLLEAGYEAARWGMAGPTFSCFAAGSRCFAGMWMRRFSGSTHC